MCHNSLIFCLHESRALYKIASSNFIITLKSRCMPCQWQPHPRMVHIRWRFGEYQLVPTHLLKSKKVHPPLHRLGAVKVTEQLYIEYYTIFVKDIQTHHQSLTRTPSQMDGEESEGHPKAILMYSPNLLLWLGLYTLPSYTTSSLYVRVGCCRWPLVSWLS